MKILHVINWMKCGGAQSLITDLLDIQKRAGLDVSLLCLIGIEKNGFLQRIEESGIPIYNVQTGGNMRSPMMIFKLIPYLKLYDVVHFHSFPDEYWVPIAKRLSGAKCKLVYTVHSCHSTKYGHPIFKYIDHYIYKHLICTIACCSDKALETFKSFYPDIDAISVPNGINTTKYVEADPLNITSIVGEKCKFTITMVARFQKPKRHDVLIRALKDLPEEIHLLFAGGKDDVPHFQTCKALAKELGLSTRIHFLGIRNDIPNLLKASDVVVLSSEYEGLSLSCLEGMAAGKPFVATNSDGLREIVSGSGLLFENGDSDTLVSHIMRLYSDKKYYDSIAYSCQKKALMYDIKEMAKSYYNIYISQYEKNT